MTIRKEKDLLKAKHLTCVIRTETEIHFVDVFDKYEAVRAAKELKKKHPNWEIFFAEGKAEDVKKEIIKKYEM